MVAYLKIGAGIAIVALVGVMLWRGSSADPEVPRVIVGGTVVPVEIADTPELQAQGLSGRESLPPGSGMLFVFAQEDRWGFWMKDMLFAIDIVWINARGEVVHMLEHVQPASYPEIFEPPAPALFVLEVPAGFAAEHGIVLGSKIMVQ